jgi:hypothetical protein
MVDDTHSFVLRIWHEGLDLSGNVTAWRGSIEHVGRGERQHFVDLDEIGRYIQAHVGWIDACAGPVTSDDLPVRDSDATTCGG